MNDDDYNLNVRLATADDRQQITTLIDSIYGEYGDSVCLDGAEADLLTLPECYRQDGGEFWVLTDQFNRISGTHATHVIDSEQGVCGFRRLYLEKKLRGTEYSRLLMQTTIDWAWEKGFSRIEFWSDTRFERAHKFFLKFGFEQDGRKREMLDGYDPYSEFFFFLNK